MRADELLRAVRFKFRVATLIEESAKAPSGFDLAEECLALAEMLVAKNALYGDSALAPNRIFSKASPVEQIRVRLDDKLNRLMKGSGDETEDVVQDLIGYLILLRVAERRHGAAAGSPPEPEPPPPQAKGEPPGTAKWWGWKIKNHLSDAELRIVMPTGDGQASAAGEGAWEAKTPAFGQGSVEPEALQEALEGMSLCQECDSVVRVGDALCDACYQRRYRRPKVDLSHVQG